MNNTAIDFCNPLLFNSLQANPIELFEVNSRILNEYGYCSIPNVYLGSDTCEFFIIKNSHEIVSICQQLHHDGFYVTFETPPISETAFDEMYGFVNSLIKEDLVDEIVFNDIGLLSVCHNNMSGIKITIGRHFDKVLREGRFNQFAIDKFDLNSSIYTTPYFIQNAISDLMSKFSVNSYEIDCLTGNQLIIPDGYNVAVRYPATILSYCTTCEFAGKNLPIDKKFIPGICACECTQYKINLNANTYLKIEKIGRELSAIQHNKIFELCKGSFKLVIAAERLYK